MIIVHRNAQIKGCFVHSDNLLGRRILEERERLGLSQQEAANAAGVRREMWAKYEAGAEPKAKVLAGMAEAGVDVQYVLTGKRQGQGIGEAAVHQAVLDAVDLLSLEKKVDAGQLAKAVVKLVVKTLPMTEQDLSQVPVNNTKFVVHGDVHGHQIHTASGGDFSVTIKKERGNK